jgi:hypothetical protein
MPSTFQKKVGFKKTEEDLLRFAERRGKNDFSEYIKNLIRADELGEQLCKSRR